MSTTENFEKNAGKAKELVLKYTKKSEYLKDEKGNFVNEVVVPTTDTKQLKAHIMEDMRTAMRQLDAMRTGDPSSLRKPIDISFQQFINWKWGFSADRFGVENFLEAIGINPSVNTAASFTTASDYNEGYRWLFPEILREAIRLGMSIDPLWRSLIFSEQTISMPSIKIPALQASDARPTKLGEAETIPTGTLAMDEKEVGTQKIGVGLKVTDDILNYVAINLLTPFFQDMGTQLDACQDNMAINALINGDGKNNNAAPVIGVSSPGMFQYQDLLKPWLRTGQIRRQSKVILANEDPGFEILQLPQFNTRDTMMPGIDNRFLRLRNPLPTSQDVIVDGAMPIANQIMLVDTTKALMKLNSAPLRMESERIVERGISGTFVTMAVGFAIMFTDARLIIDKSLPFSGYGYPAYMDYGAYKRAQVLR